jgi:hypothetical protein
MSVILVPSDVGGDTVPVAVAGEHDHGPSNGLRHLQPAVQGAPPLLFGCEAKKDARGVTSAFRYLGPVQPGVHRRERPITIEWEVATPPAGVGEAVGECGVSEARRGGSAWGRAR